ncbi:MAG TPA: hypothetical protein VK476_07450, partial [Flavobacterium sp.]|nr:hypothetical protein [Flavobacterium sp.]
KTFGAFLDSLKKNSFQRSSYNRGKKGKGRFSFATFAGKATWHTIYKKEDKLIEYDIVISKQKKDEYDDYNAKVSKATHTGTSVILDDLFNVSAFSFTSNDFKEYLAREFGWFLFLNKDNGYALKINGTSIEYENIIADNETKKLKIKDATGTEHAFLISYIRWNESIGDKCYYYFLNESKIESAKKLTSFNNNAIEFHHSVFIQSAFFNDFTLSEEDTDGDLFGANHTHPIYRRLITDLSELLKRKQKEFIRNTAADDLVVQMQSRGVFPKFGNNKYDIERKKDLISVVKELYCVEPRIFRGLKKEQEISFIGFLNLLLDSDERENIMQVLESLVQLTSTEREELSKVLKRTSFAKIITTIKLIENRSEVVQLLRHLAFDLTKFTTERDHIQNAIEANYWLFGEQYHLASADKDFETLLSNYLYIVDGIEEKQKITDYEAKRRPDIFMCRKRTTPDTYDPQYEMEENIMVELKRPNVVITKKELRQIEDYLDFILKEPRFNSQLRVWKFYILSNELDDYVKSQFAAFKDKGKRFLVKQLDNCEIYALTWDDLFRAFEIKHKYLLEKLNFDKKAIHEHLTIRGISLDKNAADKITEEIITLGNEKP